MMASGIRHPKKVNGINRIPDSGRQCPVGEEETRMAKITCMTQWSATMAYPLRARITIISVTA